MNEKSEKVVLSNEEKLRLMLECMRETGKTITINTEYKGYKLGYLQNNLRQSYFNGTLKMDEKLLIEFKKAGIIQEERKRRRKTSTKQKYDFLMGMVGKTEQELEHARMENGETFSYVRNSIQFKYNSGNLDLTPEQIENLIKAGFLKYSKEELEETERKCGIPVRHIQNIIKLYGSYEGFLEKYKRREVDYDFRDNVFCGYRGITLTERNIPQWQKLAYFNFAQEITRTPNNNELKYIDIDELEDVLKNQLEDRERQVLRLRFGLDGEKHSLRECAKILYVSAPRVGQIEKKAKRKLYSPNINRTFFGNAKNDRRSLNNYEEEYRDIQEYLEEYRKIKSFITNEKERNGIEDVKLDEIGISGKIFLDGVSKGKTVRDLIEFARQQRKIPSIEILNRPIDAVNLTLKTCRTLRRHKIETIGDLIKTSKTDLARIRNIGVKSMNEVMSMLDSLGLSCRDDYESKVGISSILFSEQNNIVINNINMPIEKLGLCSRAISGLRRIGINTVADLMQANKKDLSEISHMGAKAKGEIVLAYEAITATFTNAGVSGNEREENMAIILEMCNEKIEQYSSKSEEIKEKIDKLREILRRYDIAYQNYLEKENLFDPNATVMAVPRKTKQQAENSDVNNSEEQRRKEILLKSISDNQNRLAELEEILRKIGLRDITL